MRHFFFRPLPTPRELACVYVYVITRTRECSLLLFDCNVREYNYQSAK